MKMTKKRLLFILAALAAVAAAFALGKSSGRSGSDHGDSPHAAHGSAEETAADTAVETWTCSMHPQVRQPDPGDCPLCGMDLIPVQNDEDEEETELPQLRVSERAAALMQIETWPVERRAVDAEINVFGLLEADETRLRDLVARADSYIEKLHADHQWIRVAQGEVLAELYSPPVTAAAGELLAARGDRSAATAKLRRLGVAEDQIAAIVQSGEVPHTYEIRSPIDGYVVAFAGREGTWVAEGQRLFQIVDLSQLWGQFEAYERDLAGLRVGLPMAFSVSAFAGESFEGEITFIDPQIDPRKRTARLRVEVPNTELRLKPGMFARGKLHVPGDAEAPPLVIPKSAPLITGERAVVYVQLPDRDRPTFEGRDLVLGPRKGDYYEIHEGLEEGERVVTHGNFKIDSELQIRGRPSMMAPEGGAAPSHHGHGAHGDDAAVGDQAPDYRELPATADFAATVPESFGRELRPLVQGYIDLSEGLAGDDYEAARKGLSSLHESLLKIGKHRLKGEAHMAWMERYDSLHKLAHQLEAADDLAGMRRHLQASTLEIEAIAVNFGAGQLPELHRMYCPMVDGDKGGSWLQGHDTLNNPYYGAMMLRCGESLGVLSRENQEESSR
ncbi:MAG: efflux RND transporter periplasmic adaptor subunit [Opitutales bacterium]